MGLFTGMSFLSLFEAAMWLGWGAVGRAKKRPIKKKRNMRGGKKGPKQGEGLKNEEGKVF